ncbi:hypothetical protein LguiB_010925 [Lonicera macranthoides]
MVRGKTQMRRIENATSRQVTFSKRRNGLLKKAFELSVLCDAEVALIIFSSRGKLYEFASSSMQETIERYGKHKKDDKIDNALVLENVQHLKNETARLAKTVELLEVSKRKLLGEGLGSCTVEEIVRIEQQLEKSVGTIRAKKMEVFKDQIQQLKAKEKILEAEKAVLYEKFESQPGPNEEERENLPDGDRSENSDVETELFIGPPEKRTKHGLN